jgi:hypothetical protein
MERARGWLGSLLDQQFLYISLSDEGLYDPKPFAHLIPFRSGKRLGSFGLFSS